MLDSSEHLYICLAVVGMEDGLHCYFSDRFKDPNMLDETSLRRSSFANIVALFL